MPEQIAIWVPTDIVPGSQTNLIANHMLAENRSVSAIDVNTVYHNNFTEYYDAHIRQNETERNTFCLKYGTGINVDYLIVNANKKTYVTLLSLDIEPDDSTKFEVLAMLVFKWSPTANAVKIQALCGNQKRPSKGMGTKLLNFLKKTLTEMNINNIYLNPIPSAVYYYSKKQFKDTITPGKKIYDSSSPKPKTKSKSKTKSKTHSKSSSTFSTPTPMPTMTINLRARRNWKKAKTKMSSYHTLTRKTHGKTITKNKQDILFKKVDMIVDEYYKSGVNHLELIARLKDDNIVSKDDEHLTRDYLKQKYNID
jgi:hypothetical protein